MVIEQYSVTVGGEVTVLLLVRNYFRQRDNFSLRTPNLDRLEPLVTTDYLTELLVFMVSYG